MSYLFAALLYSASCALFSVTSPHAALTSAGNVVAHLEASAFTTGSALALSLAPSMFPASSSAHASTSTSSATPASSG